MPTLQIDDMHCESCATRIDKALRAVTGVSNVTVDVATHTAQVDGTPAPTALIQAVEKAGYHPRLAESN